MMNRVKVCENNHQDLLSVSSIRSNHRYEQIELTYHNLMIAMHFLLVAQLQVTSYPIIQNGAWDLGTDGRLLSS